MRKLTNDSMYIEQLLAYIAHNFYTQDCYERLEDPCRWSELDGKTKKQYLHKAILAFNSWEEDEMNLEQVNFPPQVKERLGQFQ